MNIFQVILCSIVKLFHLLSPSYIGFIILIRGVIIGASNDQSQLLSSVIPSICVGLCFLFLVTFQKQFQRKVVVLPLDPHEDFYEHHSFSPRPIESLSYINGVWKTNQGEIVRFRGINLPAKTPSYPKELNWTQNSHKLYESKASVSFIDRPFSLQTADEHFNRLSSYGFNLVRLSVTWEAVMHEGPGIIDKEYIEYLSELVTIAGQYGIYVIIDPHQDVWSRFTGGDGAPWWTLDVAGFRTDSSVIHDSGGAFLHAFAPSNQTETDTGSTRLKKIVPPMIWPTNYSRLVTATMFTLFFGGDTFAPNIYVNVDVDSELESEAKITIQTFLQNNYLEFINAVGKALKHKTNVLGFNTMNEPSNGYIGLSNLNSTLFPAPLGHFMNAFEGMRLGSGESLSIPYFPRLFLYDSHILMNPKKESVWKTPEHDIWKKVGVYEIDTRSKERILKCPHHFQMKQETNFVETFLQPFYEKIGKTIRAHNNRFVTYAEPHIDPMNPNVEHAPKKMDSNKFAWAPHWYDVATLVSKKFSKWIALDIDLQLPVFTPYFIKRSFLRNLKSIKQSGNGQLHVLLGEVGVPFDMNNEHDLKTNDYSSSIKALDRTFCAVEENDLDYTMWNYVPDNNNDDGDFWNGENLSIRAENRNRALQSVVRPYVYKFGAKFKFIEQRFDSNKKVYLLRLQVIDECGTNFVFVPSYHFSHPVIEVSSGKIVHDKSLQTAIWKEIESTKNDILALKISNGGSSMASNTNEETFEHKKKE